MTGSHTGTTAEKEKDHHKGEGDGESIRAGWKTRHAFLYMHTQRKHTAISQIC